VGNEKQIIDQVEAYIRQGGGEYGNWYIGLADNPIAPIMEVTRLNKVQSHRFTYIETVSPQAAKAVADYFLNVCGTDGNPGDIDINRPCRAIYIYKKASHRVASETVVPV
jgi:hypothetical protein